MSPELSPKNGYSEVGFDSFEESEFPPPPREYSRPDEIDEIRHTSEAVCRSAQESMREFRNSSNSVKQKILSLERQITSLRGSFADTPEIINKSSVRDDVTHDSSRAQQLASLVRELHIVQELLQEKEREYERRERENTELRVALMRLEVLVAEATHRKGENCVCRGCEVF